jgi:hypothetical protein
MAGKRTPTPNDYVQSGLVAMWDGIENAGWGVHDANARLVDLVGGFGDFYCNSIGSDHAVINVGNKKEISTSEVLSAEFVVSCGGYSGGNADNAIFSTLCRGSIQISGLNGYAGIRYGNPSSNVGNVYIGTTSHYSVLENRFLAASADERFSVSWCSDISSSTMYLNGQYATNSSVYISDQTYVVICGLYGVSNRGVKGELCSVRLYSRALTAAEIAANYAIDKARFGLT